jgi:hypothetical protein
MTMFPIRINLLDRGNRNFQGAHQKGLHGWFTTLDGPMVDCNDGEQLLDPCLVPWLRWFTTTLPWPQ